MLRADRSGVRIPGGARDFLFSTTSRPALGPTHSMDTGVSGGKAAGA
jgi:hypothetical protein